MSAGALASQSLPGPWQTSRTVHWILRVSVFLCFVGHGAFGLKQKLDWLAFIRPFGFSDETGMVLMPMIGAVDIIVGCIALVRPTCGLLMINVFWGVFTASLRPLAASMSFFELIERAGNFGPAIALLIGAGPWTFFSAVKAHDFENLRILQRLQWVLRGSCCLLLLGHGGLALTGKPMLIKHWASIGLGDGNVLFTQSIGLFEIILALAILIRPGFALCLGVVAWKLFTESLFVSAGAPFWEVVERGGSYGAPLALAIVMRFNLVGQKASGPISTKVVTSRA